MLQSPSGGQILTESIIFGTIGLVLFVGRLWSRAILRQSWRNLLMDDYVMVATFTCYVTLLTLINVSEHFATNEYLPHEAEAILSDPEEIERRIYGSKIVVGSNQAYLLTLWGVKACLLMLYYGLTLGTRSNLHVRIVMVYAAVGFLVTEASLFIFCDPFSEYWALPVKNQQCANYKHYCIVQMVFNVSSDLLMIAIPIPLILRMQLSPLKRALLLLTFSLGLFTVTASILDKYFNFTMLNATVYMIWHIRETSTSVYVANIMCLWPLLGKLFGLNQFLQRSSIAKSTRKKSDVPGLSAFAARTTVPAQLDVDIESVEESSKSTTSIVRGRSVSEVDDVSDIEEGDVEEIGSEKLVEQ